MTKLVLVRHGQTEWNKTGRYQGQTDVSLSAEGIRQAEILAASFPLPALDAIYASDLSRARATAARLAERFKLPVQTSPELRELDFGDWEGCTYSQIEAGWPEACAAFFSRPDEVAVPGGESFADVQQRAMGKVDGIIAAQPEETVAIVSHGAAIRAILAAALHMPLRYVWSLAIGNTSLSILEHSDKGFIVMGINDTAHLRGVKL